MKSELTTVLPFIMKRMFVMLLAGGRLKLIRVTLLKAVGGALNQGARVVETPPEVTQ